MVSQYKKRMGRMKKRELLKKELNNELDAGPGGIPELVELYTIHEPDRYTTPCLMWVRYE